MSARKTILEKNQKVAFCYWPRILNPLIEKRKTFLAITRSGGRGI